VSAKKDSALFGSLKQKHYLYNVIKTKVDMTDEQVNKIIADVLELADAEKQEYVKQDLVLFARQMALMGTTSVDDILSHFFDESMY
jgi:hypothetical protein